MADDGSGLRCSNQPVQQAAPEDRRIGYIECYAALHNALHNLNKESVTSRHAANKEKS